MLSLQVQRTWLSLLWRIWRWHKRTRLSLPASSQPMTTLNLFSGSGSAPPLNQTSSQTLTTDIVKASNCTTNWGVLLWLRFSCWGLLTFLFYLSIFSPLFKTLVEETQFRIWSTLTSLPGMEIKWVKAIKWCRVEFCSHHRLVFKISIKILLFVSRFYVCFMP